MYGRGLKLALAGAACVRCRHLSVPVSKNPLNVVYRLPRAVITTGQGIRRHLVEDYGLLNKCLVPLREAGVRVAVDDAGAGYASMRHVLAIHPDIIKLDLSLTRDIDTDSPRRALAAALIAVISDKSLQQSMQQAALRNAQRYYGSAIAGRWAAWLQTSERQLDAGAERGNGLEKKRPRAVNVG